MGGVAVSGLEDEPEFCAHSLERSRAAEDAQVEFASSNVKGANIARFKKVAGAMLAYGVVQPWLAAASSFAFSVF